MYLRQQVHPNVNNLHLDLLNLLKNLHVVCMVQTLVLFLDVRDDTQGETYSSYSQLDDGTARATAALLSMGILQIKFMRHTEPQEAIKLKLHFYI